MSEERLRIDRGAGKVRMDAVSDASSAKPEGNATGGQLPRRLSLKLVFLVLRPLDAVQLALSTSRLELMGESQTRLPNSWVDLVAGRREYPGPKSEVEEDDGFGFAGVSILSPIEKDTDDVLRVRVENMERERRCREGGGGAGAEVGVGSM